MLRRLMRNAPGDAQDYLGREVIRRGGGETLTSLQRLDSPTLSALVEWNRINQSRIERKLFIRRAFGGLLAIAATLGTLKVGSVAGKLASPQLWTKVPAIAGLLLIGLAYFLLVVVGARIYDELTEVRPARKRVMEFGQLLSLAAAYRRAEHVDPDGASVRIQVGHRTLFHKS